jgi:hypothetical protein
MLFCKNRITLIGFIGKDAQTRYTPNGTAYVRFSLLTNVSWKEKATAEYRTRTEWHSIVQVRRVGRFPQEGLLRRSRGRTAVSQVPAEGLRDQHPHGGNSRHIDLDARSRGEGRGCRFGPDGNASRQRCSVLILRRASPDGGPHLQDFVTGGPIV